jgi:hypothetical protein
MEILPDFSNPLFAEKPRFFLRFSYTYSMETVESATVPLLAGLFPLTLLEGNDLSQVATQFEVLNYPRGSRLYAADDIPDYFYWIISGNVRLAGGAMRRGKAEQVLGAGDYFGAEVLSRSDYRFSDAVCLSEVKLVRVNEQDLIQLCADHPTIENAFSLIYQTHKFRARLFFPWLEKGEKVNLVCRRHPFFLALRVVLIGGAVIASFAGLLSLALSSKSVALILLAGTLLLIGTLLTAWSALEWGNDFFILTSDRVLVQKKLTGFFDNRQEAPYTAILSTGFETSFWGRLLRFGTINLRTYNGKLSFKRLPVPEIIFDLLEYQRRSIAQQKQQSDFAEMRETLQHRLEGTTVRTKNAAAGKHTGGLKTTYKSGSFLDLAARFFGLRHERAGAIVYRTHWWRLLGKTFLPSLLLLIVVLLVMLKLAGFLPSIAADQLYIGSIILAVTSWAWWLYQYQDWYNDVYIITSEQLVDVNRKPLGKEERRSAPVQNIQTVEYKRKGIIGLVLNFGTVHIQIGNQELSFDDVYNPAAVQAEIFSRFKHRDQKTQRLEQEKLVDWIKTYDEMKKEDKDPFDSQ